MGLSKEEEKKRKEQEREFGVFYEDDYDYLQHLKSRKEVEYDFDDMDKFVMESGSKPEKESNLKLPDVVFASKEEEEIGLLNKAAPHKGPRFDWDEDIVETLDDEFKHEQVFTLKDLEGLDENEDEFEDTDGLDMILADAQDPNAPQVLVDSDDYSDYDSDEALDEVGSLEGGFSNFSDEETKSKFTNYSMSSSVIRRNDPLQLLDDKFDNFMDGYGDEEIGGCEGEELEGYQKEDSVVMKHMVNEFEKAQQEKRQDLIEAERPNIDIDESDDDVPVIEEVEEEPEDKFDCESILTTYSNIYNHPKLISEPRNKRIQPIKVSGKTGIPKDVLGKGLTTAALKQLDRENERLAHDANSSDNSEDDDDVGTVMTLASRVSELSFRNKHESKEEKKARKAAVKEFRRERRVERKANKEAFKDEKIQQTKNEIHLKKNCIQAIKLL